jgi:hypothetical protein
MTEQELSKMISEFLPYPAEGQHHALKQFAKLVAAAEREECASIEVTVTVPERDYADLSSKEIYEEALIDATLAFRAAIRERGAP